MTWVKVEDTMPDNGKVLGVPLAARWAYVASICYAGRNRTNGKIPRAALGTVQATPKLADALVEAGLWEPLPDGWMIHDFLKYNRSKDQTEAQREAARTAGKASAEARYGQRNVKRPVEKTLNESFLSTSASGNNVTPFPSGGSLGPDPEKNETFNETLDPFRDAMYKTVLTHWETETGTLLAPAPTEKLISRAETNLQWTLDAISEMAGNNVKNPSYAIAIFDRWVAEGRERAEREVAGDTLEERKARYSSIELTPYHAAIEKRKRELMAAGKVGPRAYEQAKAEVDEAWEREGRAG